MNLYDTKKVCTQKSGNGYPPRPEDLPTICDTMEFYDARKLSVSNARMMRLYGYGNMDGWVQDPDTVGRLT